MAGKFSDPRDRSFIADCNTPLQKDLDADYAALGTILHRRGLDIDAVTTNVAGFGVAIPSWGVGTGGTRFARFPGKGEPRNVFEKLEDCARHSQPDRRHADRLVASSLGSHRRHAGTTPACARRSGSASTP